MSVEECVGNIKKQEEDECLHLLPSGVCQFFSQTSEIFMCDQAHPKEDSLRMAVTLRFPLAQKTAVIDIYGMESEKEFKEYVAFEYDEPTHREWELYSVANGISWATTDVSTEPEEWEWDYLSQVDESLLPLDVVQAAHSLRVPAEEIQDRYLGTSILKYDDHCFRRK